MYTGVSTCICSMRMYITYLLIYITCVIQYLQLIHRVSGQQLDVVLEVHLDIRLKPGARSWSQLQISTYPLHLLLI